MKCQSLDLFAKQQEQHNLTTKVMFKLELGK